MARIPGSLKALLSHLIDYAGLYPPAALPLPAVAANYDAFLDSPESWILNRLILPAARLPEARLEGHWRVSLLVEEEPGALPRQVETLETKLARGLSLPTYCEAPLAEIEGAYAKIRTGGLTPEAIPASEAVAEFLCQAAARRLPCKATAGLHHPLRALHPLTYAPDSPRATMHGFVNVFAAAAFAWHGMDRPETIGVLNESRPDAFEFLDDRMRWRERTLTTAQVEAARRDFAHSFGSCSLTEPVSDLRALGWLP
ncbi:MAG: hypothetical protein LAP87_14020 [Acidobacteriia bacterium]|nr:hypothetical protein [Terriglobia bacterium]